jgi:hypothetical protein
MKIEIGESMMLSYLKHVKGCQVVQLNWKPSKAFSRSQEGERWSRHLFDRIKSIDAFEGIFKKSSFDQLLRQSEVDVLGINVQTNELYLIDIAFHENGLNYGDFESTALRVVKKIVRAIFISQMYFGGEVASHSTFCAPKSSNKLEEKIMGFLDLLSPYTFDKCSVDFISNERFMETCLDEVVRVTANEADTSELFARAIKLFNMNSLLKNRVTPVAKGADDPQLLENNLLRLKSKTDLNTEFSVEKVIGKGISQKGVVLVRKSFQLRKSMLGQGNIIIVPEQGFSYDHDKLVHAIYKTQFAPGQPADKSWNKNGTYSKTSGYPNWASEFIDVL